MAPVPKRKKEAAAPQVVISKSPKNAVASSSKSLPATSTKHAAKASRVAIAKNLKPVPLPRGVMSSRKRSPSTSRSPDPSPKVKHLLFVPPYFVTHHLFSSASRSVITSCLLPLARRINWTTKQSKWTQPATKRRRKMRTASSLTSSSTLPLPASLVAARPTRLVVPRLRLKAKSPKVRPLHRRRKRRTSSRRWPTVRRPPFTLILFLLIPVSHF